jgi:hypothetical protein
LRAVAEPTTPPPARREGLWLWALLALVVLAIAIVFVVRACDDDNGTGDSGTPPATETSFGTAPTTAPTFTESVPETTPGGPEPPEPPPPGNANRGGVLQVNGNDLYPFLGGNPLRVADAQVTGQSVPVIEVAGDSSFWVGRSKTERLLIVLNLKGSSPPQVSPGQRAQFVGQLVDSAGGDHGVTDDEGLQLLRRQGHHASVSVHDLKLR